MHCTRKITDDLIWIGVNDRRLALFENVFPIPNGVSYNSYLLKDEKTVLFDTVDKCASTQFLENLNHELNGRTLDYLIINHMEPDHCGTISDVVSKYPEIKIVCNAKAKEMLTQFFDFNTELNTIIVKEKDTLNTGKHELTFLMAPMVHWPEVMTTYDIKDKILFSADAFGTFGVLNGNIFADEINFFEEWLFEARRYYSNIVGKYGISVQTLLKKASALEINMICPLHGPIWRENLDLILDKYNKWSTYTPEENSVLIVYGSIYGHTENAAEILASKLADKGIKNIKMYDSSKTHFSTILSEAFRCSHFVIASASYNAGIFSPLDRVVQEFKLHNLQNRKIAIIENGSWALCACDLIRKTISEMKNMEILEPILSVKSSLKKNQENELNLMCETIYNSITA